MNTDTLIGHGRALMERFTDDLSHSFGGPPVSKARSERLRRHRVGNHVKRGAGGSFDVLLADADGRESGFIARVTVTYDRFDADAARAHAKAGGDR